MICAKRHFWGRATSLSACFWGVLVSISYIGSVAADQTDPELDTLFTQLRSGDSITAEETIDRIVEIWSVAQSPTVGLLYKRARALAEAGEDAVAIAMLDHVVGISPQFAQGYALRGVLYMKANQQIEALADFNRTLALEPRHFDARIALADLLMQRGEKVQAYQMFQRALEWNPYDSYALETARALRRALDGQEI